MGNRLCSAPTRIPSAQLRTGHTRAQVAPSKFDSRIVRAEPRRFSVPISDEPGYIDVGGTRVRAGSRRHIRHAPPPLRLRCGSTEAEVHREDRRS